ncbi:MAG TPA: UDP-glucose 4-epimerase GalE [Candidatus Saccharicenans sp.]|jgi:UDP-glucose 4-epimerase|nr:UDP-glucose 4-epimerase GalE [Candidatus Saccharicenans sp.]HRD02215.1 UDP-glucose 4-epimerase GalE [Candidatus Saccharicenans sp.]
MRVLVTGGAGYIGSHTVKELLNRNDEVIIFDNFSSGREELIVGGKVIRGDLWSKEDIQQALKAYQPEAVLHFASLIQVAESYAHPAKYYNHNLRTTLNLLDCLLEFKIRYFIFSSSAAVYGQPLKTPIPEEHPLNPINPYGATKFMVERMLQDYDRAYGLKYISLRYFNAAGADPEGQLGECHQPETHLIPNLLLYFLGKKENFMVYGYDFPTRDGTAIRDYIHVTDLARAHVLALDRLVSENSSQVLNLGSSRGYSVLEVIKETERVTGLTRPINFGQRREGDVPVLLASSEKAEKYLDWQRKYSELYTIIKTAWEWHRSHQIGRAQSGQC